MLLMVDVVVNHMASPTDPPNYLTYQPFSSPSFFHPECFISDYNNQTNVEQCWIGDKNLPLADINTEDPTVVDTMNNWIKALVANYTIDGIRIDTVRHVRKDFWPGFAQAAGVFTLGEVLHGDTVYVADYTRMSISLCTAVTALTSRHSEVLDGVLDYPTWYALVSAFTSPSGNITELAAKVWDAQARYKTGEFFVGSFSDNHDNPRFMSFVKDHAVRFVGLSIFRQSTDDETLRSSSGT